ncbi:hypothetical protein [Haloplanus aerogenes]|uniref:hypothetical protein n=1 Tax=Haloplanus aerogenes TaxID=660522 RepID=UPI00140C6E41|nr:hypothetical protein [Haloplanus aerogenes]
MSSERILWALVIAAVPTAVAVALAPPNIYARIVVAVGALAASFPAAYLLAGLRA